MSPTVHPGRAILPIKRLVQGTTSRAAALANGAKRRFSWKEIISCSQKRTEIEGLLKAECPEPLFTTYPTDVSLLYELTLSKSQVDLSSEAQNMSCVVNHVW